MDAHPRWLGIEEGQHRSLAFPCVLQPSSSHLLTGPVGLTLVSLSVPKDDVHRTSHHACRIAGVRVEMPCSQPAQ